jgi:hypothetical protein
VTFVVLGHRVVLVHRERLTLGCVALLVACGTVLGVWVATASGTQASLSRSSLLSQCDSGYLASTPPIAAQVRGEVGIVVRRSGTEYAICGAGTHAIGGGGWTPGKASPVKVLYSLLAGPSGVRHGSAGMWTLLQVGAQTRRVRVATQLGTPSVSYLKGGLVLLWFAPNPTLYDVFNAYEGPKSSLSGKVYAAGEVVAFSRSGSVIGSVEIDACPGGVLTPSPCLPQPWAAR